MANVWVANGSSYITCPTLGDLTGKKVRVVIDDLSWSTVGNGGYVFGQAGTATAQREHALWGLSDTTQGNFQGSGNLHMDATAIATAFGSAVIAGKLDLEVDTATGAYTFKVDDATINTGTFNVGDNTGRIDGMLWRFGARNSVNDTGTGGAFLVPAGTKVGDAKIYVDDILVRHYVMPISGTNVPELISSADGTLQAGTGGGADWEAVAVGITGTLASTLEDVTSNASGTAEEPVGDQYTWTTTAVGWTEYPGSPTYRGDNPFGSPIEYTWTTTATGWTEYPFTPTYRGDNPFGGALEITVDVDTLVLTESVVDIQTSRVINVTTNNLVLDDIDVNVGRGSDLVITATTDALVIAESDATVLRQLVINATTDALVIDDIDVAIFKGSDRVINAIVDTLVLTELPTDISREESRVINVETDQLVINALSVLVNPIFAEPGVSGYRAMPTFYSKMRTPGIYGYMKMGRDPKEI